MDPLTLTLAAGAAAIAGTAAGLALRHNAGRADAQAAGMRWEQRDTTGRDPLTDIPDRESFSRLGADLLADRKQPPLVGVVIDLDRLRLVNEALGRAAGDEVLATVARRLSAYVGDNLVGRLGGDEFAAVLSSVDSDWCWPYPAAAWLAEALAQPIRVAGQSIVVTATVGLAPVHGFTDLPEILRRAERAVHRAKAAGRTTACFDPLLDDRLRPTGPPPSIRSREAATDATGDPPNSGHWLDERPRTPPAGGLLGAPA